MTERLVIRGGRPLSGSVRVSGAKNAALPILAAAILGEGPSAIHGLPDLRDVAVMIEILRALGCRVECEHGVGGGMSVLVDPRPLASHVIPDRLMREMRSSIFLMGPLLGRLGRVRASQPGGCAIGPRPIDLHLRGLAALGAQLSVRPGGYLEAGAPRLIGCEIHLDFPSVGATENLMMAAVRAEGATVIGNAAKEPEIVALQTFLSRMGARVTGAGTDVVRVEGTRRLTGAEYGVIPDRIEAGTLLAAAAMAGGDVTVSNVVPEHLEAVRAKLREAGATVEVGADTVRLRAPARPAAIDLKTLPYPGFPTDLQSPFMALLSVADGVSMVTEAVFENRFAVAEELRRMGAQIRVDGRTAVVRGVRRLTGAAVDARELRGGAALVLAGLVADGETAVSGVEHIDRGYERIEAKLAALGADIRRVGDRVPAGVALP